MAVQLGNGERAVWASAIGSSSRHDTTGSHNGADTNVSGGAFGLETQVGRASLFGMALGNSWTRVSAHGFGTIEQDTTHLGIYGQTNWRSGISADWSAAYGRSESESMGSEWNQKHLQLDGRVSYNHELNARTVLSPFAGVQYYASDSAAIGTTDAGSLQNLRAEIGVAASHRTGKLGVYGEIALHQDLARNNPTVSMEDVRSTGMNPGRTGINFTIGASYELSDKWSVNASYTGEFVENANAHSANVGASYKF
jgi:outer membrane autotransporter protein